MNICVVVPVNPKMAVSIYKKMVPQVSALRKTTYYDFRPAPSCEVKTPWSKVAAVRNRILDDGFWRNFSHLLWIDADVIYIPETLAEDLASVESNGVVAPVDLIEGTQKFHDWAAFIYKGKDGIEPTNRRRIDGRNIRVHRPFFDKPERVVEMDCVGTVTLVNTDIYRAGARYEDHPAFTDHYPICKICRDIGRRVAVAREVIVFHADLPKYGEKWK